MTRLRRSEHVGHPAPVVPQRIQPPAHPAHGGPNILGHPSDLHKHPNGHQLGHLTWPKTAKPQVRRGGPLAPLKGWGHVGHPTPGGRRHTTLGTPTQHHHPMTFPDVKGDPMTTDTPTNRHDDEERIARVLHALDVAGGPCDGPWEDLTEAQQEVRRAGAAAVLASLPAGLPTPPEASDLGGGRMRWHPTAGLVVESPEDGTGRVRLAARTGLRAISADDARLLAATLLAAAEWTEGGTR